MENKNKEEIRLKKSEENMENVNDDNSSAEFVEKSPLRPKNTPDVKNRKEKLDKIKKGELGTGPLNYNDDGSQYKGSSKKDIDTNGKV